MNTVFISFESENLTNYANNVAAAYAKTGTWTYANYCPANFIKISGKTLSTIAANNNQVWGFEFKDIYYKVKDVINLTMLLFL